MEIQEAIKVIRALADGRLNRSGAYICAGLIDLDAIEREFQPYRIATYIEIDEARDAAGPA